MTDAQLQEELTAIQTQAQAARDLIDDEEKRLTEEAWARHNEENSPALVFLATDVTLLDEVGATATVVAELTKMVQRPIQVKLKFSGTATEHVDYTHSDAMLVIHPGELRATCIVTSIDDTEHEIPELIRIEVGGTTAGGVTGGPVEIELVSDDSTVPPEPPDGEPPPVANYDDIVIAEHPRLLQRADIAERLAAAPEVWPAVVSASDGNKDTNRMLCRAARYVFMGEVAYGHLAIEDMFAISIPSLSTHYDMTHLQPHAIAYDWVHDLLTPEQAKSIRNKIFVGLGLGKYWTGYNQDAGIGMISALAMHGDVEEGEGIPLDYVKQYWNDCWWKPADYYNREYERNWQRGGGMREGWSYFADQCAVVCSRACWELATGDTQSLSYPWMNRMPLLLMHQCRNPNMWSMPNYTYGSNSLYSGGVANIIEAGTGNANPVIAAQSRWYYEQNAGIFSTRKASDQLIYRVLIGDPRVAGQSPEELGLPKLYVTKGTGYVFDRDSWDDMATRVYFGCQEALTRDFPACDIAATARKKSPLGSRTGLYRHHYGPWWVRNMALLYQGTQMITPAKGDSTPRRSVVNTLRRYGEVFVGEKQGMYSKQGVELMRRTWGWSREQRLITVVDEIRCPAAYVPRIAWNTPERPVLYEDGIMFTCGDVQARLTYDEAPAEVLVRGGEEAYEWARDYAGNVASDVANDLCTEFADMEPSEQISVGGYFTAFVTPALGADGTYRLTSRIQFLE